MASRDPKLEALVQAAAEVEIAAENWATARAKHNEAQEAALKAFAEHAVAKSAARDALKKLDAARRALGIVLSVGPLTQLNLIPTGERPGDEEMATKNELGYKLGVTQPPADVKNVKATASVGGVVYLDETFDVPGESAGEFWVEQGSEISVATQTIDDSGNVQTEEPKVFTFTATDTFPPAPLSDVGLVAVGERTVDVPDDPAPPADPPSDPPVE